MAAFNGRVQGHRGEANRLGSRDPGITSDVKSRETEFCVQAGSTAQGEERFEILARDIASGTKPEISRVRRWTVGSFSSPSDSISRRAATWHQWATSLGSTDEVA